MHTLIAMDAPPPHEDCAPYVTVAALLASAGEYYGVARTLNGAAPDVWSSYGYEYGAYNSAANTAFVQAYESANGQKPIGWSYDGYLTAMTYMQAIDKAGSGDPSAILKALPGLSFDAPSGKVTLDATRHQLMGNIVVAHTVGDPQSPEGVKFIEADPVPATAVVPASS